MSRLAFYDFVGLVLSVSTGWGLDAAPNGELVTMCMSFAVTFRIFMVHSSSADFGNFLGLASNQSCASSAIWANNEPSPLYLIAFFQIWFTSVLQASTVGYSPHASLVPTILLFWVYHLDKWAADVPVDELFGDLYALNCLELGHPIHRLFAETMKNFRRASPPRSVLHCHCTLTAALDTPFPLMFFIFMCAWRLESGFRIFHPVRRSV